MTHRIETTSQYWDCECKDGYIHSHNEAVCGICLTFKGDAPDSRIKEVRESGFRLTRALCNHCGVMTETQCEGDACVSCFDGVMV